MKLKLTLQRKLFLDLTTQKLTELRQYLGLKKLQFFYLNFKYLKGFRNNFSIFELTFSKLHFKKAIKLIYLFHSKKKKILFIGFDCSLKPFKFKELVFSHNHFYFSDIWVRSLITSSFSQKKILFYLKTFIFNKFSKKNSIKKSPMIKELSFFTEAPDLIVYFFEKNNKQLIKEIEKLKNPSVILANDFNNLSNILYKMFGNFSEYKKKQFFFFILKSIFSLTKIKLFNKNAKKLL